MKPNAFYEIEMENRLLIIGISGKYALTFPIQYS